MKSIFDSYPLVWLGETMGASETLSKEKRYQSLSRSFKILSSRKTDEEIWEFYQWRRNSYRSIRLFTSFILAFFTIMAYILTGFWIIAVSVGFVFLVVYGAIAVTVKPERKYAYLWDDKDLFMEFLKLNRSESFEPINFDQYLEITQDVPIAHEPNFQEELLMVKKKANAFNSVQLERVIDFFDVMREKADYPKELKCVQISDEDFLRFIKARFVDNSDTKLGVELIRPIELAKKDKGYIKTLFYNFYIYSTTYHGESKKGMANSYMDLYLKTFDKFKKADYTNFSDSFALEFSKAIKEHNNM